MRASIMTIGGLVIGGVTLAAVVTYFDRADSTLPVALARAIDDGCPEGSFCGQIAEGTGTDCEPEECCERYECFADDKRETLEDFPNAISANEGFCMSNGPKQDTCKITKCEGNDCDPGPCMATGAVSYLESYPPVQGRACGLGDQQ